MTISVFKRSATLHVSKSESGHTGKEKAECWCTAQAAGALESSAALGHVLSYAETVTGPNSLIRSDKATGRVPQDVQFLPSKPKPKLTLHFLLQSLSPGSLSVSFFPPF